MRSLLLLQLLLLASCSTSQTTTWVKPEFNAPACGERVYNRGKPPAQFLKDLYEFIVRFKDDATLVGVNNEPNDVFGYLWTELKLEKGMPLYKRAARLYELMRVSAAMESSWDWDEDYDVLNPHGGKYYGRESGIFQTSANSHVSAKRVDGKLVYFRWEYLDNLMGFKPSPSREDLNKKWWDFHRDYKNKDIIMQHHAFMLRHSYRHYGPMISKKLVAANLNHKCIEQVEALLK